MTVSCTGLLQNVLDTHPVVEIRLLPYAQQPVYSLPYLQHEVKQGQRGLPCLFQCDYTNFTIASISEGSLRIQISALSRFKNRSSINFCILQIVFFRLGPGITLLYLLQMSPIQMGVNGHCRNRIISNSWESSMPEPGNSIT